MERCAKCKKMSVYTDLFTKEKTCQNRECHWKSYKESIADVPVNMRRGRKHRDAQGRFVK